jgi:hypothetical protein
VDAVLESAMRCGDDLRRQAKSLFLANDAVRGEQPMIDGARVL